ncbi:hypothetical protein BDV06DRAFT_229965 [Aspergillus oleicola]
MTFHQAPKTFGLCTHDALTYLPSPHAREIGYKQPSEQVRLKAAKPVSSSISKPKVVKKEIPVPSTRQDVRHFPTPLILPNDDLAQDPEYPAQSYQEWYEEEERNPVTARRRTVYIVAPPGVDRGVGEVESWAVPITLRQERAQVKGKKKGRGFGDRDDDVGDEVQPKIEDVRDYLAAFFRGLPVKVLDMPKEHWKFSPWEDDDDEEENKPPSPRKQKQKQTSRAALKNRKAKSTYLSLSTGTEAIRIRARRSSPNGGDPAIYSHQLNLNDLLDVAIEILPSDAYALCMLVHHDLYEDDEDLFVCGRAYGGSRIAVVSTARYRPSLDGAQGVEVPHAWPRSHCVSYIEGLCNGTGGKDGKKGRVIDSEPVLNQDTPSSTTMTTLPPLEAALSASLHQKGSTLWLSRTLRTTSHELSHCFGLDHCVYYACIMQGSASLAEDARQPPYLCPVDLAKVLSATGSSVRERDEALLEFCEREDLRGKGEFSAWAGWLRASLRVE